MTGVYSGGLVYEYSMESNNYGLVEISGDTVTPTSDFTALQSQLAANKAPSGDGGYKSNGTAATCPDSSDTFKISESGFTGEELPSIPSGAVKYMSSGAGTGPGLTGDGSQQSGESSTPSTATPGSGSATATASQASSTASKSGSGSSSASASAGAASSLMAKGEMSFAPLVFTSVIALSTLLGALLL